MRLRIGEDSLREPDGVLDGCASRMRGSSSGFCGNATGEHAETSGRPGCIPRIRHGPPAYPKNARLGQIGTDIDCIDLFGGKVFRRETQVNPGGEKQPEQIGVDMSLVLENGQHLDGF